MQVSPLGQNNSLLLGSVKDSKVSEIGDYFGGEKITTAESV